MIGLSMTDRAIIFATRAHRNQMRKASDTPYISHPFGVAMLLQKEGYEEQLVVAGLLHDTLEDTEATEEELSKEFGPVVLDLVKGCSEPNKSLPWEDRKKHTIEFLETAPISVCLITCADKLHNLRTLQEDKKILGESLWDRFARGKDKQKWYYTSVEAILKKRIGNSALFKQLEAEIASLFSS